MSRVSDLNNTLIDDKEVFTLYRYRYWIGIIYIIATNLNIISFALFGSLQSTLVNVYDEELTYVNFATLLIFNVTFIPSSFVANYIIDTYGLKPGFLIGNILNLIGLWIRCLSKHSFGWIFAGQCFMGIAQPFFGIAPQKVSSVWFGPSERTVATTVFVCCTLIGNAVGGIAPQWFVDIKADNLTILNQLQTMFLYLAIICSVCYIFIIPPMREKPPTPPSKAAAATKYNYVNSLKSLLKNKNAMMMIVSTAVVNGTTTNYASTIQQTVLPFGINGYQVADVMSIALLVTPVGYFIGAGLVAKYKKYHLAVTVISFSSLAFLVLNFIAAASGNIYFYGATAILYGINVAPNGPIALEFGMELAFPVAEATLGAVWSLTNQISCTVESLIVDAVLGKNPTSGDSKTSFIIIAGYQGVMILLLFFVKERLKRTEFESKNQDYKEVKDEINP